jgi:hypothetical protein
MRFFPTSLALVALGTAVAFVGCAPAKDTKSENGEAGDGGTGTNTGGAGANAGTSAGGASSGNGGANTGGVGAANGGASTGGANVGGSVPTGGVSTGGASTGGATTGGAPTGGATTGGATTGGATTGGTGTGGAQGGMGGTGGGMGGAADVDKGGKRNARPGDRTSTAQDYLRMGEIRLLNNNWGSQDLGCNANMSVFVNTDRSFGWSFNRGNCDTANSNQHPDFPQLEFGIHPFGIGNALATSPDYSSTTLLPLQIRNITSANVTLQNLNIQLQQGGSWNITFEFWLSQQNPNTQGNAGVHTELMTFWGWQSGRWPTAPGADGSGGATGATVTSSNKTYTLWVQDDTWADGWRYYQFRDNAGPGTSFNGTVNVKTLLDYLVNTRGFSPDLWVTRLEIGSEIDDLTQGTVTIGNVTFEINGQSRSPVFSP